MFELRNTPAKIALEGGVKIDDVCHSIKMEHVGFGYPYRDPLFYDLTFEIPAGKITAVVGASGSGKSTIANLLLRLAPYLLFTI